MSLPALDPKSTAVLVIDMQNDFCERDGYYASVGVGTEPVDAIIPTIARLLAGARRAGALVLYTAVVYQPAAAGIPSDIPDNHTVLPTHFKALGERLVAGSWGAAVTDRLAPAEGELVIEKPGWSAFYETPVESLLRQRGVKTVVLTGTATYGCVLHTAYDAFVRDHDVVIVEDAVACSWPEMGAAALSIMGAIHGPVVAADEVLASIGAA